MNIDTILKAVYSELKDFPAVAEEFFQASAYASSEAEFLEVVKEFAPGAIS